MFYFDFDFESQQRNRTPTINLRGKAWDNLKGRRQPVDMQDYVNSKQRLRAALRKISDIKEVACSTGYRKYKIKHRMNTKRRYNNRHQVLVGTPANNWTNRNENLTERKNIYKQTHCSIVSNVPSRKESLALSIKNKLPRALAGILQRQNVNYGCFDQPQRKTKVAQEVWASSILLKQRDDDRIVIKSEIKKDHKRDVIPSASVERGLFEEKVKFEDSRCDFVIEAVEFPFRPPPLVVFGIRLTALEEFSNA
ncbi:hypothetical protein CDAR_501031 [Caerostris darwini]|uniref:IRF tryptophan pentad repeat domain-containing protein n=1 Tax=Caerostris darwini TaxID=1538125 RepID=A0AAV4PM73_9ARAC|nr:hypothetical protein CDAR_501031 [Caerostris darwini]